MAPADPFSGLAGARLLLVSGKGGVGKTAVAAALAARSGAAGRRVLLMSTDGRGDAAALFGRSDKGYAEAPLAPGLHGLTAEFDALLGDFVRTIAPAGFVANRVLSSATFRYFTRATPGLADLLLLGKVRELFREKKVRYDLIVIDAPATGHAISLFSMPRTILSTVPAGPMRHLAVDLDALLSDRQRTVLVAVAEPAEFAAREAEELIVAAREKAGLETALLVVNRVGRSGRAETLPRGELPVVRVPELDAPSVRDDSPFSSDVAFFAAFRSALEGSPPVRRRGPAAAPPGPGDLDLDEALRDERLVVLAGPGGVGKTTLAAAVGIASARSGKRTLVLTVDPARRLAQALGLSGTLDRPVPVPVPGGAALRVMQIDPRATFERLLVRVAPPATLKRIHDNRLYEGLVDALPGVVEYMGVEALAEHANDPGLDRIVLDTAPAARGVDFLKAPQRMVDLLENDALRWFLSGDSILSRALSGASRGAAFVLHLADRHLGFSFLADLADFFRAFDGLYAGFRERNVLIRGLLADARYLIVSSADRSALRTASELAELLPAGPGRAGLLLNRVSPRFGLPPLPLPLRALPRRNFLEEPGSVESLPFRLADQLSTTVIAGPS
ncbi:MAG: AAA family ATPase [Holophagales bacterium]|nr:AAA family ATPase [Holophagales bacterium]